MNRNKKNRKNDFQNTKKIWEIAEHRAMKHKMHVSVLDLYTASEIDEMAKSLVTVLRKEFLK